MGPVDQPVVTHEPGRFRLCRGPHMPISIGHDDGEHSIAPQRWFSDCRVGRVDPVGAPVGAGCKWLDILRSIDDDHRLHRDAGAARFEAPSDRRRRRLVSDREIEVEAVDYDDGSSRTTDLQLSADPR